MALGKTEVFPVMTPTVEQICTRVVMLQRLYPGAAVELAKRDIARAFKLIPVRPQLMSVLSHAFSAKEAKTSRDIIG